MFEQFHKFTGFVFRILKIKIKMLKRGQPPRYKAGLRLVAVRCHPVEEAFIIDTDNAPAGLEELMRQMERVRREEAAKG
jgi:hypothetical protein